MIRVLLVEDNAADARLAVEALQECTVPTHIAVVGDGIQALSYLRCEGQYAGTILPDILLLDLNLPKMDGRKVLMEIKSDHTLKHIPVIIFSANRNIQEISRQCNADGFIAKPFNLNQLLAVISNHISNNSGRN